MDAGPPPENLPDGLSITFAADNAIRIRSSDQRVELNLAIARLKLQKPAQTWKDFIVRVFYKPDLSTPGGRLTRDGTVQLVGDRLGPKAQIALRGIFSKAFPQGRGVAIIPDRAVRINAWSACA